MLGLIPIAWILIGTWLLMFVLDAGKVNLNARTAWERLRFLAFWPFIVLNAVLVNPVLLQKPRHAEKCISRTISGACDCPTRRGDVLL